MTSKPEIYLDTRGEAGIENFDDLAARFPRWADRAANSALSSEGYRLNRILRLAIDRGGPPTHSWDRLHPYTMRLRKGYRNRTRKKTPKALTGTQRTVNPLLKFKGAIRYKVDKEQKLLTVGFVNASAKMQRLLGKHARGYDVKVTPAMRRMFFALGLPLEGGTRKLEIPERELIDPVFLAEQGRISANLERKFFENMQRYQQDAGI